MTALVPVPLTKSVCGPPAPSFMTVMVPLRLPVADGLKLTLKVQAAPIARLPQVLLVTENSPPLPATLDTLTAMLPMLRTSTVRAALVAPTAVSGSESALTNESWPLPGGGSGHAGPAERDGQCAAVRVRHGEVPLSAASALGAYATANEHEAPAASVVPQRCRLPGSARHCCWPK